MSHAILSGQQLGSLCRAVRSDERWYNASQEDIAYLVDQGLAIRHPERSCSFIATEAADVHPDVVAELVLMEEDDAIMSGEVGRDSPPDDDSDDE